MMQRAVFRQLQKTVTATATRHISTQSVAPVLSAVKPVPAVATASTQTAAFSSVAAVAKISEAEVKADDAKYILGTYARFPHMFVRGEGCYLYDADDVEYLDFYAGIAVNSLGHTDPDWLAALTTQAGLLTHTSNLYFSAPQVELAKQLLQSCDSPTCCGNGGCFQKVFFCNSGTEANEGNKISSAHFDYFYASDIIYCANVLCLPCAAAVVVSVVSRHEIRSQTQLRSQRR